jgi:DNA replication protein DnaC
MLRHISRTPPDAATIERFNRFIKTGELELSPEAMERNRVASERSRAFWSRQEREQKMDRARNLSEIGPYFAERTFETFRRSLLNGDAYDTSIATADALIHGQRSSLGIYGPLGNGKSHLAAAIVNKCRGAGIPAVFTTTVRLISRLQACSNPRSREEAADLIEHYAAVDVLVLDDLGKERLTEWGARTFFELINARYEQRRPLIATANMSWSELGKVKYERLHLVNMNEALDPTLGPAIMDRIREMTGPWIENKAPGERGRDDRNRRRSERTKA